MATDHRSEDQRRRVAAEWLPVEIRVIRTGCEQEGYDYEIEVRADRGAGAGMFHTSWSITEAHAMDLSDLWYL